MPPFPRFHRQPAATRRRRALGWFQYSWVVGVTVLVAALAVGISYAAWQAQVTQNNTASGAVIAVTLDGVTSSTIADIEPGTSRTVNFQLVNSSTTELLGDGVKPSATVTQVGGSGLVSDFNANTAVTLARCTAGWNWNSGSPSCTTWTDVATLTMTQLVANGGAPSPTYIPSAANTTTGLRYTLAFDANMPSALQSAEFSVTWNFDAQPRAGGTR